MVGVARQTISKWELGETAPDIKQAKILAQIFNISLDELTDNDVKELLIEKVSNTERLAGIVIKILKVMGILIIVWILFFVLSIAVFSFARKNVTAKSELTYITLEDYIGETKCSVEVGEDGTFKCSGLNSEIEKEIRELVNFDDLEETEENILEYFAKLKE